MSLRIFWTPQGVTLDSVGTKRLVDISDGDTPNIRMNIRMLSIDTPEKAPTGSIRNREALQTLFGEVAGWIADGRSPVPDSLASHLAPRLARTDAVEAHLAQGAQATLAHEALVTERLRRPSGRMRTLFVRVGEQPFDSYGRLLAYVAPNYSPEERASLSRHDRATFNLLMVERGWAAPFVLFPSIPGEADLPMLRDAARTAIEHRRGAWADPLMLTGYEFRMAERLAALWQKVREGRTLETGDRTGWATRYCADMSTAVLHAPSAYDAVAPHDRLFIWPQDVRRAVADLNLVPGPSLGGA